VAVSPVTSPEEMGSIDKALIKGVIEAHRSQIRYCYESALAASPALDGKVVVRFVIVADGKVAEATVKQSTLGHEPVEKCITERLLRWEFPKPKGGGKVVVSYPFIFRHLPEEAREAEARQPPDVEQGAGAAPAAPETNPAAPETKPEP
jgi:TonB family protein